MASPGYYRVLLPGRKITVELTATEHCGIHRYHFASAAPAKVIIDLRHGIGVKTLPEAATMTVKNDRTISGSRRSSGFLKGETYYFVAEFSKPFKQVELNMGNRPVAGPTTTGKVVWGAADFGPLPEQSLEIKVGLSAVSVEAATGELESRDRRQGLRHPALSRPLGLAATTGTDRCPVHGPAYPGYILHRPVPRRISVPGGSAMWMDRSTVPTTRAIPPKAFRITPTSRFGTRFGRRCRY